MPGADDFSQHAWLILSRAPEASGITSTIDSNSNLEIVLATTEYLKELQQNNMYEPEDKEFVMANGDAVHDNSFRCGRFAYVKDKSIVAKGRNFLYNVYYL